MPRHQRVQLWDLDAAAHWLVEVIGDVHSLRTLRAAFGADPHYRALADQDDSTLIARVAHLIITGELWLIPGVAPMSGGAPPWTWRFPPTPSFPISPGKRGSPGGNPLAQERPPTEEEESELVDEKPDPIIPPVYPNVAEQEAAALMQATDLLNIRLEMLKHLRDSATPLSEVAQSFRAIAASQGQVLEDSAGLLASALVPLASTDQGPAQASRVASAFRDVAAEQGRALNDAASQLTSVLAPLARTRDTLPSLSQVARAFQSVAKAQGAELSGAAASLGLSLEDLVRGEAQAAEPSAVAALYRDVATHHGEALQRMAGALARLLGSST